MSSARQSARPAVEVLEQAVALLRRTPGSTYLAYYFGSVPFWLALLYFVADTSRSAFASARLIGASFTLALLYLHMKCWHTVFTSRLRELLLASRETWSWRRVARLAAAQALWQPTGLIVRPLAYLATIPAVWVSTFYQNLTILGDGRRQPGEPPPGRRAWAHATLWSGQAHRITLWLGLFSFFVWVNLAMLLGVLPDLLKMFLGWETMASRGGRAWILNSTFPAVTIAASALCLDPLWKAAFALRCFYGESVRSGADLAVQLKAGAP